MNNQQSTINNQLSGAFAGKNVWLSGVSGFKGSWLAEWLLSLGAQVHGFSLPPPTSPSLFEQLNLASRIKWDCDDLRDADAVKKSLLSAQPDFVFHLAAQPLVRLSYREPVETWQTNVIGTINVLEALRCFGVVDRSQLQVSSSEQLPTPDHQPTTTPAAECPRASAIRHPLSAISSPPPVVAVMVTTDKCYENREWLHGYREEDALGGHDPYSSSKAACELAIASWRRSFFSPPQPHNSSSQPSLPVSAFHFPLSAFSPVLLASARAGNVIGGGDWAADRIVPDCIRALQKGESIPVRNKTSTRPWQHVLEPLSGYLLLASKLSSISHHQTSAASAAAFNFGPNLDSNRSVADIVSEILKHWPGEWQDKSDPADPHEAGKLNLATDKAYHLLGWHPRWDFPTTIEKTVSWYREANSCSSPQEFSALTQRQIEEYHNGGKKRSVLAY